MCETQQIGHFFGSINHRRLWQSMLLSKTWENIIFPGSKMDSLHILCISAFSISEDAFTLCIGFLTDSGRCFLRPKLSILYSMYPIIIIHIYIYIHICTGMYIIIYDICRSVEVHVEASVSVLIHFKYMLHKTNIYIYIHNYTYIYIYLRRGDESQPLARIFFCFRREMSW